MSEDILITQNQEKSSFIGRDSIRSENTYIDVNLGPKSPNSGKLMMKRNQNKNGYTLDEELVKVRGNGLFAGVVSSVIISFAFAETIVFALPFLELIPPLECRKAGGNWHSCFEAEAGKQGVQYRPVMGDKYTLENWVDDLGLMCREEWEVGTLGSACFAGMFIGALTLSPISDLYGRKPVHIISGLISLLSGIWIYIFPNWYSIIISLVLKGIGMYSRLMISYLYTLELFDEERGKIVAMITMSINNFLSGLMAMYFMFGGRDATIFILGEAFVMMYSLIFIPILPESPKLLYSQKEYDKTREGLSKMASINGVKYKEVKFEEEVKEKSGIVSPTAQKEFTEHSIKGFVQLFKKSQFVINIIILVFVFMNDVFAMYMLSFMLKYLPGDKYVNLFLLGAADFLPSLMSGVVLTLFPTKRGMIYVHTLIGVFTILHLGFGNVEYLGMPLIFFIRFCITLESGLNFYVVYELFPARFASAVYGACNITAGLVSICSPMAVEVIDNPLMIVLIMGGVGVIGGTMIIPDTKSLV